MGLFDFFFTKPQKNPTEHWSRDLDGPPTIDLDAHGVHVTKIGGAIEELRALGPGIVSPEGITYPKLGLILGVEEGLLNDFAIVLKPFEDLQVYEGDLVFNGKAIPSKTLTHESDVVSLLGQPYWRDEDEFEVILFYEHGEIEWQIECSLSGQVARWAIVSPPLLAGKAQREAYGVDAPWPPPSA